MNIREAVVKLGITRYRILYWARKGLIEIRDGDLGFTELKKIRFLQECLDKGISEKNLIKSVRLFIAAYPQKDWFSHLESGTGCLFIREGEMRLEPGSGQMLLAYSDDKESREKAKILRFAGTRKSGWSADADVAEKENRYLGSLHLNDDSLSEKLLLDILRVRPSHKGALIEMGNLRFEQNRYDEAFDYYDRALQSDPHCPEALYNMANICLRRKKYAAAIRYFERSLEIDPDFPDPYFNLGLLYFTLGYLERAEFFLTAYTLLDDDPERVDQAEDFLDRIEEKRRTSPSPDNGGGSVLPLHNL